MPNLKQVLQLNLRMKPQRASQAGFLPDFSKPKLIKMSASLEFSGASFWRLSFFLLKAIFSKPFKKSSSKNEHRERKEKEAKG